MWTAAVQTCRGRVNAAMRSVCDRAEPVAQSHTPLVPLLSYEGGGCTSVPHIGGWGNCWSAAVVKELDISVGRQQRRCGIANAEWKQVNKKGSSGTIRSSFIPTITTVFIPLEDCSLPKIKPNVTLNWAGGQWRFHVGSRRASPRLDVRAVCSRFPKRYPWCQNRFCLPGHL